MEYPVWYASIVVNALHEGFSTFVVDRELDMS